MRNNVRFRKFRKIFNKCYDEHGEQTDVVAVKDEGWPWAVVGVLVYENQWRDRQAIDGVDFYFDCTNEVLVKKDR